ncbi:hypothetical protein JTE90_009380 [Oedothorax gibbosus]|uniref:Tudor domain-containing protein 1 n=1 Tax=Oedothorax gibbosus TaxID=931172 RepID=A0AAV6VUZ0_9ARAC|nr:hypothetical protein JTE90_009380 [Oedothorax gibbosus]
MSSSELDNWNPMAEDFNSRQFNAYNTEISCEEYDLCALYVQNVPSDLTENVFQNIFKEYGRIVRFRILPKRPDKIFTIALVTFETEAEAEAAKSQLHNCPPLNLQIRFANRSRSNATLKDVNMNLARNTQSANQTSRTLGRGRSQHAETETLSALKVTVDGNKRIAFNSEEIPKLIPNPNLHCLVCKKIGELSCGVCEKPYCSLTCQAENWRNHKSICKPVEKKEIGDVQQNYKSDGYISAGSNSDSERRIDLSTDPNRNKVPNPLPIGRGSLLPTYLNNSSNRAIPSANAEFSRKHLTNIKYNEIEDAALPLNRDEKVYVCHFQNPSKLWLHLKSAKLVLSEMETKLKEAVDKSSVPFIVNDVCCTLQDGVFCRVQVKEVKPNTVTVYFVDYGSTSTLNKNLIYHLPPMFRTYRSQAVCCKLINNDGRETTDWNGQDFSWVQEYTKGKEFKMKAYRCYNNVYDVSLLNDQGLSLMHVITHECTLVEDPKSNSVPSVCSKLKEGMEFTVKAMDFDKEQFWGILHDAGLDKCLSDIDELLKSTAKDAEVVNMSCEEGDVVIGFSTEFQMHYRCVVLKRLRNSFLVRYIDYGNSEEITELRKASPPVLLKQSYVVCCTKPKSMSFETFQKTFSSVITLSVKSVKETVSELSFEHSSQTYTLQCFPWYHGVSPLHAKSTAHQEIHQNQSDSMPLNNNKSHQNKFGELKTLGNSSVPNKTHGYNSNSSVKVMKDSVPDKKLVVSKKYKVNISTVRLLEIYVQLIDDEQGYNSLSQQINQYCTSDTCPKYRPVKDEMICCIFHEDSKWYRAQVLEKLAEDKFKVFFVDFGNIEIVSEAKIKPLPQKLATEKLAVCVSLLNVKNEDISKLLSKLLEVTVWIMEVKDISNRINVMFYQDQKSLLEIVYETAKFHKRSLKFQKLPSDKVSEVVICHEDDKRLYFQQLKDLEAIFSIQQQINSGKDQVLSGKPEVHNIYCCRSALDNKWYRACVRSVVTPNIYKVQFIDYGNDEDVSTENFKEISEDLFQFPVYCIPVIVEAGNKPAPLVMEKPYSVQVIDDKPLFPVVKFLSKNTSNTISLSSLDKVTLKNGINKVLFFHSESGIHYCQLIECACSDMSSKLQASELKPLSSTPEVNTVVCAKSGDGYWYRASIAKVNTGGFDVFFIDFGNSEMVPSENVKFLPEEFCKYPIFGIPVRIKNESDIKINFTEVFELKAHGFASDGSQFAEIIVSKGTDVPNISSLENQVLPVDQVAKVYFSYIENDLYYVQLTSSQKIIESLGVELNNAMSFENLSTIPKEGDIICAKSGTDNTWYRGSIKNVSTDQNNCQVYFIDYGNSETVAFADLRMLPSKLCTIPILAVPVKLVNIVELEKLLLAGETVFKIKVINSADNIPTVEIVTEDNYECFKIENQVLSEAITEVVVTHNEGRVYYVQKTSDLESLSELMKNLQSDNSIKPISSPEIGQLVCAKFHDGMFYRGLVKHTSGNDIKVFFVDYGNTDEVTDTFSLPPQYSQPMFSIPIIISNEEILASLSTSIATYKVMYTGKMENSIQIVKVCLPTKPLLLPTLKTSVLEKGSFEVRFHSSDGQFYFVSKATDSEQIEDMNCKLVNISNDNIYHVPSLNEVLIVKSQEKWLRGCVNRTDEITKKCEIYLLDLGSTETIPFAHLSYVPKSIISYPIFINKVLLNSSDSLTEPIQFGKHYTVTVVGKSNEVPIIKVLQPIMFTSIERKSLPLNQTSTVTFCHKENDTLFLQDTKDALMLIEQVQPEARKCAASEVISHNPIVGELLCAQSDCDGDWYRCCVEEVAGSDKYRILFIDYGNCEVVSKGNLRYLPKSLAKYPAFAIAVKIVDQQPVVLEQLYSVVAVSEPVNNLQSVKLILEEKVSKEPADEMPKVNEIVSVTSTEIISPNEESEDIFLYSSAKKVTFPPGEQDIAIYSIEEFALCEMFCTPIVQEDILACNQMSVDLTQYCTGLDCSSYNGETLPEEDQMVLAKFAEDGQWYRAVVIEVSSDTSFQVVYADFGNSAVVDKDSLRKMTKEFMSIPIQAVPCGLTGFKVIGEQTSVVAELKKFISVEKIEPLRAIVTIKRAEGEEDDEEITMEIPIITKHLVEKGLVTVDKL